MIKVNATIDEVAKIKRQGNSAVIHFKNGETITIENYFDYAVNDNRIVLSMKANCTGRNLLMKMG